jgi:hypothetical protein
VGLALGEVVGAGVVHGVAALPGEVGDQQGRVEREPDAVLEPPVAGERAVAALVGDDPQADGGRAGDHGVQAPDGEPGQFEGEEGGGQGDRYRRRHHRQQQVDE